MKANSPKSVQQKAWDTIKNVMNDNIAMMLLVLHNEYGFGRERIGKLLDEMTAMAKEFDEYQSDGVFEYKREKLTGDFLNPKSLHEFLKIRLKGVIPEEHYNELFGGTIHAFHEAQARYKNSTQKQQQVDVAEAAEIQRKVLAMKEFCGSMQNITAGKETQ